MLKKKNHIALKSTFTLAALALTSLPAACAPTYKPIPNPTTQWQTAVALIRTATANAQLINQPAATTSPISTPIPGNTTPEMTYTPSTTLQVTCGTTSWSDFGLSFWLPCEWYGSYRLPSGDGVYAKHTDLQAGILFQVGSSSDSAQLLAAWGKTDIEIPPFINFTPQSVMDGETISISRLDLPSRIATGNGLTAQTVYIQRPQDILHIVWYSPSDEWGAFKETFSKILTSIELWQKYVIDMLGIQVMYTHDWPNPHLMGSGNGYIFQSTDMSMTMAIMKRDIKMPRDNPAQLINSWRQEFLVDLGMTDCSTPTAMGYLPGSIDDWALLGSYKGTCKNAGTTDITYMMSFVIRRDRSCGTPPVLEIVFYSPTDNWEESSSMFGIMLGMLKCIKCPPV